jgi:hypothetical protein
MNRSHASRPHRSGAARTNPPRGAGPHRFRAAALLATLAVSIAGAVALSEAAVASSSSGVLDIGTPFGPVTGRLGSAPPAQPQTAQPQPAAPDRERHAVRWHPAATGPRGPRSPVRESTHPTHSHGLTAQHSGTG